MSLPRIVIAGANSGAGKTTVSIGLMAAYLRRGLPVQPFKVGPDFIDPAFHSAVTGRPGRNLDPWLTPEPVLRQLFRRHAPERGISIIEGVMGLYDGLGNSPFAGTAHVASLLAAPVVLVVNARGMSLSAAALVSGFARFRPEDETTDLSGLRLGGVILNRVSGRGHYDLLRSAIEKHTGIPCLGFLPKNQPELPHRHLGLVPAQEQSELLRHVEQIALAIETCVDLSGLLELARSAPEQAEAEPAQANPERKKSSGIPAAQTLPGIRIGIARDAAFTFYYPDNVECLEELGAKLVPFSPLEDAALPEDLDGLYLGGGFPEVFAERLEANTAFRMSLRTALEKGLPAYAECGGMLYLCASLAAGPDGTPAPDTEKEADKNTDKGADKDTSKDVDGVTNKDTNKVTNKVTNKDTGKVTNKVTNKDAGKVTDTGADNNLDRRARPPASGRAFAMAGFFPVRAAMTAKLQPFGYVTVRLERDCLLGPAGSCYRAHEFHYSRLLDAPEEALIRSEKPDGRAWTGGLSGGLPGGSSGGLSGGLPGGSSGGSSGGLSGGLPGTPVIRTPGREPFPSVAAWYPHLHFRGCPEAAQSFVQACRTFREQRRTAP